MSSTWRELKAIHNVLLSFAAKLQGHKIKWFTDNQAAQSIVTNGSRRLHLQDGALSIFELYMRFSIRLKMEWIPRGENEQADFISRIIDFDDCKIDPHLLIRCGALILWIVLHPSIMHKYLDFLVVSGTQALKQWMLLRCHGKGS